MRKIRLSQTPGRRPALYACLIALALFPLLLLAINSSWAFPPVGWLDPWIYSGYHTHFKLLWDSWPNEYYGSRVPWTVFGYFVHRFFSPAASLIVLALCLFYASAYSLFYAINRIFKNAAAGFIVACLLGTNCWFLLAIGWNYIDGPSIACTLLSIAALVATAHERHPWIGSLFWGALSAAMIALYPINLVLILVEILLFVGLDRLANRRIGVRTGAFWCAGFAGATVVMGLLNWSAGGKLDFISETVRALHLVTPSGTNYIYVVPWTTWAPDAPWLFIPGIAFAACVGFVSARRNLLVRLWQIPVSSEMGDETSQLVIAFSLLVAGCGFLLMQGLQFSVLAFMFRANAILPFAYLALGGFIAIAFTRETHHIEVWVPLAAALVCLAPWLLGYFRVLSLPLPNNLYAIAFTGIVLELFWIFATVTLILSGVQSRKRTIGLLSVALLSLLNVATLSPGSAITLPQNPSNRDRTLATFAASKVIDTAFTARPLIWWDRNDPDAGAFSSLAIMYLDQAPADLASGERVVFIRSSGFRDHELPAPFSDPSISLTAILERHVQEGATVFEMTIATVRRSRNKHAGTNAHR